MPPLAAPQAGPLCQSDDPSYYVITLSTWVTDRQAAFALAVKITENLASVHEEIDEFGTTIMPEDDNAFGQERIYEHMDIAV